MRTVLALTLAALLTGCASAPLAPGFSVLRGTDLVTLRAVAGVVLSAELPADGPASAGALDGSMPMDSPDSMDKPMPKEMPAAKPAAEKKLIGYRCHVTPDGRKVCVPVYEP